MKNLRYLLLASLIWIILGSCEEKYKYNTRVVTGVDLVGIKDGNLLFSRGESEEIKIKIIPVDAIDKKDYTFSYKSSDENIFTIDDAGKIQALATGEATLTVQAVNNPDVSQCFKIVVQPNWIHTIELPQEYRQCNLVVNSTLDLGSVITIKPEQADNPNVIYTSSNPNIATVTKDGIVTAVSSGNVDIVIQAVDQGGAMASASITVINELFGDFPRHTWEATASHTFVPDASGGGAPEMLLDGNYNTFLSIRKPGKGDETPEGAEIFFTVDMRQQYSFNYFRWHHRGNNNGVGLRVSKVDILGSLDGKTFEVIQGGIPIDTGVDGKIGEKITLNETFSYRYVRFLITGYSTSSGSAVQISEIQIGRDQ